MQIRLAKKEDISRIRELIDIRISWMDENNIRQWNLYDYLNIFSYEYFEKEIDNFYVATENERIVGAIGLLRNDEVWKDKKEALYIHNLVGDVNTKGVGKFLLECSEKIAKDKGINILRLDCQIDNKELNDYYDKLGYRLVGTCVEGDYTGNKREKILI